MQKIFISVLCCFFLVSCSSQKSTIITKKNAKIGLKKPAYRKSRNAVAKTPDNTKKNNSQAKPATENTVPPASDSNTEILVSTSRTKVSLQTISNYVLQYKDIAMSNMRSFGIPASIILAQGILESGAGSGTLAINANNHFGIKCHKDWDGDSVRHDDDAAQECFRKYPDPAESFKDHALFLTTRSRYSNLFKLPKSDYQAWARGLRSSGYATDPRYPEKLILYIEKYALQQYDNEVLGILNQNTTISDNEPLIVAEPLGSILNTADQATYEIQKGDTLYSLSKKFSITVDELKEINQIVDNSLSVGQKIRIKKTS